MRLDVFAPEGVVLSLPSQYYFVNTSIIDCCACDVFFLVEEGVTLHPEERGRAPVLHR
jgi:hypothetical protein